MAAWRGMIQIASGHCALFCIKLRSTFHECNAATEGAEIRPTAALCRKQQSQGAVKARQEHDQGTTMVSLVKHCIA